MLSSVYTLFRALPGGPPGSEGQSLRSRGSSFEAAHRREVWPVPPWLFARVVEVRDRLLTAKWRRSIVSEACRPTRQGALPREVGLVP